MKRSFLKSITWRCCAVCITTMLTWYVTGQIDTAIHIGVIDTVIKLGAYMLHEQAWER